MCPACMASAALMAGSVVSTGGIAALAVKVVRCIKGGQKANSKHKNEVSNNEQRTRGEVKMATMNERNIIGVG